MSGTTVVKYSNLVTHGQNGDLNTKSPSYGRFAIIVSRSLHITLKKYHREPTPEGIRLDTTNEKLSKKSEIN